MGLYSSGGGGTTVVQAPPAPNYQESMRSILQAQVDMAPQVYQSESQYQPLYNALQAAQQAFQVQQNLNIAEQAYPQIAEMEAAYNQANRQAELNQLQTALPEYQRAFNALTPGYAQAVASAGQLAQSAMAQSLNRPQFSSFENTVRDPYGRLIAMPQPQVAQMQPQMQFQMPSQALVIPQPQQQTALPASTEVAYNNSLQDKIKEIVQNVQNNLPGAVLKPQDPGPPIDPIRSRGWKGFPTGPITNQAQIDARNAEIAKYKTDLAAFEKAEAEKKASSIQFLANFNPAAAFAPQKTKPSVSAEGLQLQNSIGPVLPIALQESKSAPSSPQGPVNNFVGQTTGIPSSPPQPMSPLEQVLAGGYVGAVKDFAPSQKLGTSADMLLNLTQRELAAGKRLTPEEQRMADQSVRAAYAARGMALGNQAIGAEVLNRADVADRRYQQRLQNAANAAQVGMSQQELLRAAQAQRFQQAMGREELSAATQQSAFNQALARSQAQQQAYGAATQAQAAQAALGSSAMGQLQAAQAPVLQAFYKQPILQGQENQAQQMAMMMQQQAGPQYFNPESATGMGSIYGAYNAQMNLAGAQAQANAARSAGKSSMMGSIIGGGLGAAGTIGGALVL